jgi:hypothetical protein
MYICCKVKNNSVFDLTSFKNEEEEKALELFIKGTSFTTKSIREWVDESGYYMCNDGNWGEEGFGLTIKVIINMDFYGDDLPINNDDFDIINYLNYHKLIKKEIRNNRINEILDGDKLD